MTAGRMMTALGALALGLATAGAVPALAQQGGAATTTGAAPAHNTTGTPAMNTAQATGTSGQTNNAAGTTHSPAAATGTNTDAGTANPAAGKTPMTTGEAAGTTHATSSGMNAKNAPQHMNAKSRSTATTHHPMEHRRVASRSSHISNANPNAQNAEIDRLNQESLQAAQQGRTFTPSRNM